MATEGERKLFVGKILAAVGRESEKLPSSKVTGFMAMVGCPDDLHKHPLMVVGRAVNGWGEGVLPEDLALDEGAERYSQAVLNTVNGEPCPMIWVTEQWGAKKEKEEYEYNTKGSAFWRTIRDVVAELKIADVEQDEKDSWPSHLVWSNLYKVSPAEGRNPGAALCRIQLPGCIDLFRLELKTYTPSRLLFLTGKEWVLPFLTDFDDMPQNIDEFHYVERYGTLSVASVKQPIQYVVAVHPQGKPEKSWVAEVCCAFKQLDEEH